MGAKKLEKRVPDAVRTRRSSLPPEESKFRADTEATCPPVFKGVFYPRMWIDSMGGVGGRQETAQSSLVHEKVTEHASAAYKQEGGESRLPRTSFVSHVSEVPSEMSQRTFSKCFN